jgi:hypothetical protein
LNREEEEFNVAIAISASLHQTKSPIHQKSQENKQSKPFKNQEQNITIETEPNSYHTTTYKIYNRTQTPPPPYTSCSPDPTTNSGTKNLEFSRNLEKLDMDTNSVNCVERIYPSLSGTCPTPSMIHQTNSPIHQIPIPQVQETVLTLRNQNVVKPNPSILFQFLVCGKDINAS